MHARKERLIIHLKKKGILEGPTTSLRYSGPEQRCQLCGSRLKMAFPTPTLHNLPRFEGGKWQGKPQSDGVGWVGSAKMK